MPRQNIGISLTALSWVCSSLLGMATKLLEKRYDTADVTPDVAEREMFRTWISVLRSSVFMLTRMGSQICQNELDLMDEENGHDMETNVIDGIEFGQNILHDLRDPTEEHGTLMAFADTMTALNEDSMLDDFMEHL